MNLDTAHSNIKRSAFTLLELMVAMVIMVIALSIAFQAFSATTRGWKRGMEIMEGIQHGDFAMTQLMAAVNSTIYFYNARKTYAFTFEKESANGLPADSITFVTASGAFMPHNSPFAEGPHRLKLFIDDEEGESALFAQAMPAIADAEESEEDYDAERILITRAVQGLEILVWDEENEDWTEEWEEENSVPERIKLTIFVASQDKKEDPIEFTRVLEIPVAKSVTDKLTGPTTNAQTESSTQSNRVIKK